MDIVIPSFDVYFTQWADHLDLLRQDHLLAEGAFIDFARNRGVPAGGVVTGDPGKLYRRGWLRKDGEDRLGDLRFHPFRILPLHVTLEACELNIGRSSTLDREEAQSLLSDIIAHLTPLDELRLRAQWFDRVADLAILLEPIYWPYITSRQSRRVNLREDDSERLAREHADGINNLLRSLDPGTWRSVHERLRIIAARMDENADLYLLLRLTPWSRRERLTGQVSGALWIRHIAEVLRRAFESVTDTQWPEEFEAFGMSIPGVRERLFGSERPLDDPGRSRSYVAWEYGLLTGPSVRWYVEGDTEYFAVRAILQEPAKAGIALLNLRGRIAADSDNVALKLADWLAEDESFRRFSMISFDSDVPQNVKTIGGQVRRERVVGYVAAHKPDFEFANFTCSELVDVAVRLDEAKGVSGAVLRAQDWSAVRCARDFETLYKQKSARHPRGLKGQEWGRALARYAREHPRRADDDTERPFWRQIRVALTSGWSRYDSHKEHFRIDPESFELVPREKGVAIRRDPD